MSTTPCSSPPDASTAAAVADLMARAGDALDVGRAAEWAACFADDGVWTPAGGVAVHGRQAIAAELALRTPAGLRRRWPGTPWLTAHAGGVRIRVHVLVVEQDAGVLHVAAVERWDDVAVPGRAGWIYRERRAVAEA